MGLLLTRLERLLTWKRARNYSLLVGLLYVTAWAYFTFAGAAPLNRTGEPIGGDYVAFHTAGRMLLQGEGPLLYDRARVIALQEEATLGLIPRLYDPFRNPAFFALPFAPLALLDLVPSFAAWTVLSVACLAAALWLALDTVPWLQARWRAIACITFGFAPVYLGLVGGQNSTLALLLYVLVYRDIRRGRERRAGVWAALGLFKPQLFLVLPLVFLAARRWQALGAYAVTAASLGLLSLLLVGVDGLQGWLPVLFSDNLETRIASQQGFRMHSLKAFFDLLLPGVPSIALVLSLAGSLALLVPLVRAWAAPGAWAGPALPIRFAFTLVLAVLVDPHIFDYDLTILVLAGILAAPLMPGARWWMLLLYALLFLREPLPIGGVRLQPTVLAMAALAWWLWPRIRQVERTAASFLPAPRVAGIVVQP